MRARTALASGVANFHNERGDFARIRRKREMMTLWIGWLDDWCAKAIAADPVLSDREALVEAIYRERYTEEQLARRIAYRSRRDRPLWNHLRRVEEIDAAE